MIPEIYYVELHLAQVTNELEYIKTKVDQSLYNNKRIGEYVYALVHVLMELKKIPIANLTKNGKVQVREVLFYVSKCIQYLKSATIYDLDPAMYICLRAALEDWVSEDSNNYIITSYKANVESHHYTSGTILTQAIRTIEDNFKIKIPYKLVALGYPSYLEKDFISNVSLYHELGHFVDFCEWRISYCIITEILSTQTLPLQSIYFKNIDENSLYDDSTYNHGNQVRCLANLISEYFADIFAVQYVGRHKNHLANYMAGDNGFSYTHPSTAARIRAISNFLGPESEHDELIKLIKEITLKSSGRELKVRNEYLNIEPLLKGEPYEIINREQLHSLFHNAWEIWETNITNFKNYPEFIEAYKKLNNLLRLSIKNYEAHKTVS